MRVAAVLLSLVLYTKVESRYMGCYIDTSERLLAEHKYYNADLTIGICTNTCKSKGFRYAGMESSNQCFCSNKRPSFKSLADEADCNMRCHNYDTPLLLEMCGGTGRISVHDLKGDDFKDHWVYEGCFVDQWMRVLPISTDHSDILTYIGCSYICSSRGEYLYFGVELGVECFCGNSIARAKKVADSECSTPCSGNREHKCGGDWRIGIFRNGISGFVGENPVSSLYKGCFKDNNSRVLPDASQFSKYQTPEYCAGFCNRRGFRYAGVENGIECYCGNSLEEAKKMEDEECSMACSGDGALKCGGFWRISIYKID